MQLVRQVDDVPEVEDAVEMSEEIQKSAQESPQELNAVQRQYEEIYSQHWEELQSLRQSLGWTEENENI